MALKIMGGNNVIFSANSLKPTIKTDGCKVIIFMIKNELLKHNSMCNIWTK